MILKKCSIELRIRRIKAHNEIKDVQEKPIANIILIEKL